MRTTSLQQFIRLRRDLTAERDTLQSRLQAINEALGQSHPGSEIVTAAAFRPSASGETRGRRGKRTMSPEARARIAAAQRARWAKQKGARAKQATAASNGRPKRRMRAAGRKAIAEAARKRWAAAKAVEKSTL
jgi:hypothetical protein